MTARKKHKKIIIYIYILYIYIISIYVIFFFIGAKTGKIYFLKLSSVICKGNAFAKCEEMQTLGAKVKACGEEALQLMSLQYFDYP